MNLELSVLTPYRKHTQNSKCGVLRAHGLTVIMSKCLLQIKTHALDYMKVLFANYASIKLGGEGDCFRCLTSLPPL